MKRTVLTLAALIAFSALASCKDGGEPKRHGPALTPVLANQLKSLAGECEIRPATGKAKTKELRLCKGRQAMMTIHLDDQRHLLELEIGLWAPTFEEAEQLVRLTMKGIVPPAVIAATSERLRNAKSEPVTIEGVRVDAFRTQAPNENPRYTAVFSW